LVGTLRRVLIADDDSAVAATLARYLTVRGWQTSTVGSATELFTRGIEDVQAVVLDMRLPDASGLDVLAELRRRGSDVPVLIVSGFLDARSTIAAMRQGAIDALEKPVDTRYLEELLSRAIDRAPETEPVQGPSPLVGRSRAMRLLREQVAKLSQFRDLPVLIIGESGTGKELVARALHEQSHASGPLVAINCAAMPENLFESELFGHAAGSFTGARGAHAGLLEAAGQGTVFFDEVGEMPASLQAKLLRVLETQRIRRVGSSEDIPLRARVVSATNRQVRGSPTDALRPDLYFRLAGYTILTPPLRTRLDDVEELAEHFLLAFRSTHANAPRRISREALDALRDHDWPGNVRELRAVLQAAAVRAETDLIGVRHVVQALHSRGHWRTTPPEGTHRPPSRSGMTPSRAPEPSSPPDPLGDEPQEASLPDAPRARAPSSSSVRLRAITDLDGLERELILRVTDECNGNLSLAARRLQIPRSTLRDKLRRYGRAD
jgi:DNA-binding NtrC family response regulator